jgi:hypothetical protein
MRIYDDYALRPKRFERVSLAVSAKYDSFCFFRSDTLDGDVRLHR